MGNFSYVTGIPATNNNPSQDQPNMQTNTDSISGLISVDHIGFGTFDNSGGTHNQVQLKNRPPPLPPGGLQNGYETLYSAVVAGSGEIFFTRGALGNNIQLTGPGVPSAIQNGYTFLPGGILLQWGFVNGAVHRVTTPVLFPTPFPTVNGFFSLTLGQVRTDLANGADNINIAATSTMGFSYYNTSGSGITGFYWMAIGN